MVVVITRTTFSGSYSVADYLYPRHRQYEEEEECSEMKEKVGMADPHQQRLRLQQRPRNTRGNTSNDWFIPLIVGTQ